jgi:hypothetical protein
MPLLFSYGTLQQRAVQMSTFGRVLQGHADELVGFERSLVTIEDPQFVATSGKAEHAIVTFNGRRDSRVSGTVFEISDRELAAADQYEPVGYKRIGATLASGKRRGYTRTRATRATKTQRRLATKDTKTPSHKGGRGDTHEEHEDVA